MKKPCVEMDKKHYINVNPDGNFKDYKFIGLPISKVKTSYTDVDDMFIYFRANNIKNIGLFFHGGLVGECNGMEAAARFHKFYNGQNDMHTVSFVWETGILTSLIEHFKDEALKEGFKKLFAKVAEKLLDKLGINVPELLTDANPFKAAQLKVNVLALPAVEAQVQVNALTMYHDKSLEELENEMLEELSPLEKELVMMEPAMMPMNKEMMLKGIPLNMIIAAIKVAARCIYRFARNRDHGIQATVTEEVYRQVKIGPVKVEDTAIGVWDQMKRQAETMWKSNATKKGDNQFAGRYFLDKLAAYISERQAAGETTQVNLIGHSAGSIAICELFDLLKMEDEAYGHIQFNNVLFMAPACKCDLFEATIPGMRHRFNRFRMFTMKQEAEKNDTLVDLEWAGISWLKWVYPHSLLYFVSGLCENGDKGFDEDVKGDTCILGLEQHIDGSNTYMKYSVMRRVHDFLYQGGQYQNNVAIVPSPADAPAGYKGRAADHGYFDNDGEDIHTPGDNIAGSIRESILYCLAN